MMYLSIIKNSVQSMKIMINEMVNSSQLTTGDGKIISIMSLFALYQIAAPMVTENEFVSMTSKYITEAPAIKPETKKTWLSLINKQ